MPKSPLRASAQFNLTPRETQIAILISHGKTTREVAAELDSTPSTIDTHRSNILRKLGKVGTRANAVITRYVIEAGLE